MSVVLAPHLLRPESSRFPVDTTRLPPAVGVGLLAVVTAIAVLLAALPGESGFRIVLGTIALFGAVSAAMLVPWTGAVAAGRVRVHGTTGVLRFVAPPAIPAGMFALAVIALAGGLVAVGLRLAGVPDVAQVGVGGTGPYALGLVGLVWLAQQLWALRVPAGLTLDARGVRGARGTRHVDIPWDDLAAVDVVGTRGAKLVLTPRGGSPVMLDPHWFGSDPNLVAPVVEHFRVHPEDRAALVDGRAAIRLVEDAVSRSA